MSGVHAALTHDLEKLRIQQKNMLMDMARDFRPGAFTPVLAASGTQVRIDPGPMSVTAVIECKGCGAPGRGRCEYCGRPR